MTDLATLGLRVEAQEVAKADAQLDGLTASAGRAETATERLAAAARGNGAAVMTMNTAVSQQVGVMSAAANATGILVGQTNQLLKASGGFSSATESSFFNPSQIAGIQRGFKVIDDGAQNAGVALRLTGREGMALTRQFADIGVTAAMGMNPLMIAIQQGPQLLDIFQEKAITSGATIRAVMAATAASIYRAMIPLLAILAPIAVGVAALAAGWALASRSITNSIGDVGKEMNLTEEQLERLKEKNIATTATMGDSWNALGTTIKEMFVSVFGDQLSWVDKQWNAFLDDLTANTGKEVDAIAGFFTGAYNVVRDTWKLLPRALGDAAVTAANGMIAAINGLIEKSVAGVNRLRAQYNSLPAWMRNGQTSPMATAGQIGSLANPYSGGMSAAAETAASSYGAGVSSRQGMSSRFMGAWRQNTRDTAEARITPGAGDAGEKAAKNAKDAADAVERLVKVGDAGLAALNARVPEMIEPLRLIADEMRLIDGLAQDMASGLASAFGESGAALGDLLTTMSGYQSRLADINLAEREYRLTAGQADRERSQAQIQNYGDMAAAARGFFEEGSEGYRVMMAVEQAFRLQQMIGMIQSIFMGQTETAATLAQNTAKTSSFGIMAVVRAIASLPFPLNLAAGAATLAAVVAVGAKMMSGAGGGARGASSAESAATDSIRTSTDMTQARVVGAGGATTIRVVPNDDRFNAYVDNRAQPAASAAYRASVTSSRGIVPADQNRRDRFKLGGKSAYGR